MSIIAYQPDFQPYFEKLNKAWIEKYFKVEPLDEWVLTKPDEAILKNGGSILFAREGNQIIGTVALRLLEPGIYELTKMAVDENFRGHGTGKQLVEAAIRKGIELQADKIILYSNTTFNEPAIRLYRKLGFKEIQLEKGTYVRADIKMEYNLKEVTVPG